MKNATLEAFGGSRRGHGRGKNDDRFLVMALPEDRYLVAVSDGMGGHPGGDVAAEIVTECLRAVDIGGDMQPHPLRAALLQADALITDRVMASPDLSGMGATATAVLVANDRACWAHVGDSRLYLLRQGRMRQISRDHSYVQTLVDRGELTRGEADTHPHSHVLDKCVGCLDSDVDTGAFEMYPEDILLLCTDGLYRTLSEPRMAALLSTADGLDHRVATLLAAAVEAGNADDATLVAAGSANLG